MRTGDKAIKTVLAILGQAQEVLDRELCDLFEVCHECPLWDTTIGITACDLLMATKNELGGVLERRGATDGGKGE